jgi:hypothetical protein
VSGATDPDLVIAREAVGEGADVSGRAFDDVTRLSLDAGHLDDGRLVKLALRAIKLYRARSGQ